MIEKTVMFKVLREKIFVFILFFRIINISEFAMSDDENDPKEVLLKQQRKEKKDLQAEIQAGV